MPSYSKQLMVMVSEIPWVKRTFIFYKIKNIIDKVPVDLGAGLINT